MANMVLVSFLQISTKTFTLQIGIHGQKYLIYINVYLIFSRKFQTLLYFNSFRSISIHEEYIFKTTVCVCVCVCCVYVHLMVASTSILPWVRRTSVLGEK